MEIIGRSADITFRDNYLKSSWSRERELFEKRNFVKANSFLNELKAKGLYNNFEKMFEIELANFQMVNLQHYADYDDPDACGIVGDSEIPTIPYNLYTYKYDEIIKFNGSVIRCMEKMFSFVNDGNHNLYLKKYVFGESSMPDYLYRGLNKFSVSDFFDEEIIDKTRQLFNNDKLIELYNQREKLNSLIKEEEEHIIIDKSK